MATQPTPSTAALEAAKLAAAAEAEAEAKKLEAAAAAQAKAAAEKSALKAITLTRDITLNLVHGVARELKKGVQLLEAELHDHWFVKAHTVVTEVEADVKEAQTK